ncbi:hypothetical protein ABPG77_008411 [Micractinium sp. CCAP 211/92]
MRTAGRQCSSVHMLASSALASAAAGCPAPAASAVAAAGGGCSQQAVGPSGRLQAALQGCHSRQRRWHSLVGMPPPTWPPGFAARQAGSQLYSERARQRSLLAAAAAEPCLAAPTEQGTEDSPAWERQCQLAALPGAAGLLSETANAVQHGVPPSRQPRQRAWQQGRPGGGSAVVPLLTATSPSMAATPELPPELQRHVSAVLPSGAESSRAGGAAAPQPGEQPFQLPVPNLGYTCLNIQLQQQHGIRTNRSCRRRTFEAEGLPHVSRLALANCRDLLPLVAWNAAHGIHFFRIPSALFPWDAEYELEQLPDFPEIAEVLAQVGAAARAARQRLTCHPSHYVQLATPDERLRARSMRHLELNARVFDLMGYPPSHENKINIHVGGHYGCKRAALARFAAALDGLSHSCRSRLTVENDDRRGYFSTADLLPLHAAAGVPIVFDFLHHALLPGGLDEREALLAALATWPAGVRPVVHYSEPSENPALARRAHSHMLTRPFELYGREADVDVMLEAKGMEQALLFYRDQLQLGRKQSTTVPRTYATRGRAAQRRPGERAKLKPAPA